MVEVKISRARLARIRAAIAAAVACSKCPQVTAERGVEVLAEAQRSAGPSMYGSAQARKRAVKFTEDPLWRKRALAWLDGYWAEHGHGPTWSEFRREPSLWPEDLPMVVRRAALPLLARTGCLDGTKTPYGLRVREPRS